MIIVGCPVQNRDWVLPYYLKAIYDLDYDKKEIKLCFLVNDSTDGTDQILIDFRNKYQNQYAGIAVKVERYGFSADNRDKGRNTNSFQQFAFVRNKYLELVKQTGVDYLFSVDSDILVPSNSLRKLISNDKDICSMLVNNMATRRGYGKDAMNILEYKGRSQDKCQHLYEHVLAYPQNTVFEVEVTGAAYLIKRKVLSDVRYEWHNQGEDIGFCVNAKKKGYRIWCDSTLYGEHIMNREVEHLLKKEVI